VRILLTADPEIPVPPLGYGGIERIVDALVRALRAEGHQIGLAARSGSTAPADAFFPWPGGHSTSLADTMRNALALRTAIRRFRPDILHSFSRLAYLLPLLPTRLPKLMSYQRHTGGRQIAWAIRLAGRTLRFTGCSEFICSQGRKSGGQWDAIPNFVELEKYTFVPSVPPDSPLVFLSRIETIKGPDLAIAIAVASGRRLILAGNPAERGPEREYWERKITPLLNRNGVEWIGEVNDEQKNRLLGRAAALLLPIQWDEPFGIVFAEALAAGTPIITCARGALPEIVEPGRTGFFIRDAEEGVAAVRRLGDLDRAACRRTAETRFSLEVGVRAYLSLYREMTVARTATGK
jgi:glycosyltransferase involved in cell wall biosynthesis